VGGSHAQKGYRVLVVEQGAGLWGAQRYLLRLAPLLEARGFQQILAAPHQCAVAQAWRKDGRVQVDLEFPSDRGVRAPNGAISATLSVREAARTLRAGYRIAHLARMTGADVIHANSHWSHGESVLAARFVRRPVVLHLHEENEPDMVGRLRGLAVLGADASIAVSDAVAQSLPPRAARRAVVIRNGVDPVAMSPGACDLVVRSEMTSNPEAPLVLVLSRLDPRKGVDHVIRAVAGLPEDLGDVSLAVAGAPCIDAENGARLESLGSELLGERVRFLGPRSDVSELLRAADTLILASTLEGLPLSVLEAQACGLPVVAYPTAGIPEVITHEETGLLATPGSVEDLSRQLVRVLRDAPLRQKLALRGRERVLRESTLSGQADMQAELLAGLAARR
jgi:glycosyltransferase involved in cell wall biosynthesis